MAQPTRIIVFGDLVYNFQQDLRQLLHNKSNANLVDFISRATFALCDECAKLPQLEQDRLPQFSTLVELLDNSDSAIAAPAVRFALLCLYQVGCFVE